MTVRKELEGVAEERAVTNLVFMNLVPLVLFANVDEPKISLVTNVLKLLKRHLLH